MGMEKKTHAHTKHPLEEPDTYKIGHRAYTLWELPSCPGHHRSQVQPYPSMTAGSEELPRQGTKSHESTAVAALVSKRGSHTLHPGTMFQESRVLRI